MMGSVAIVNALSSINPLLLAFIKISKAIGFQELTNTSWGLFIVMELLVKEFLNITVKQFQNLIGHVLPITMVL
jgi:hypothetical protein